MSVEKTLEDKNRTLCVVAARTLLCLIMQLPKGLSMSVLNELGAGDHPLDDFMKMPYSEIRGHIVKTRKRVLGIWRHNPKPVGCLANDMLEHFDVQVPINPDVRPNFQWRSLETETRVLLRINNLHKGLPANSRLSSIQSDLEGKLLLDIAVSVKQDYILLRVYVAKDAKHPLFKISEEE